MDQHSTAGRAPSGFGITRTVPPGRSVATLFDPEARTRRELVEVSAWSGGQCVMLSPEYPPALEADSRSGWNLKEQRAGQQQVDRGAESVEGRDKRDPARRDLGDSRHQKRNNAEDKQRHEQAGDQTIAAHLAVIVCVET